MSLDNFIPQVWASEILRSLRTSLVYAQPQIINRDYEGEIANAGDTVRINMIGAVTVNDYTKNVDIASAEVLTDAQTTLKIDQAKYFNFQIGDVDQVQQSPKVMGEAIFQASYALRKVLDSFIAGLYTDIPSVNMIGTDASPITGTWATAGSLFYDRLVDLGVLLDNQDVPDDGRWAVIPPWAEGYLLKDARFVGYGTGFNAGLLTNGFAGENISQPSPGTAPIGRAAGFDLFKSNQVPNTSAIKYKIIAGHNMGWSFASQINKVEGYRHPLQFSDSLKGLSVYGAKVVRPNCLALLTANPT